MTHSYLNLSQQGNSSLWHYLVGILLIFFFWFFLGGIFVSIITINFKQSIFIHEYFVSKLPDIFSCLGVFLSVVWVHQRRLTTLFGVKDSVQIKRLLLGFGIWSLLLAIFLTTSFLINPRKYLFTFNADRWLIFLPFALVFTPIQVLSEELLFRGYLLQGLSKLTKQPLILIILNSLLFAVPHFSTSEMQRGAVWMSLYYFVWGVFLAAITLKDNRIELALGIHMATNLYSVLFVQATDSAIATPTIWKVTPNHPTYSIALILVLIAICYFALFLKRKVTG